MEVEEYSRIAAAEDEHWWYANTRALITDLLGPWLGHGQRILDAGCGPGGNGAWLARHGDLVGVDLAPDALRYVHERRPTTRPVRGSISELPFASKSFDVAVAITVVTCVPDDALTVRELARVLRSGGAVLLFEPAFRVLGRAHDVTVHSLHRYRRAGLAHLAQAAGLTVRRATYAYSFLAPPAAVLGVVERRKIRRATDTGSDLERRWLDPVFGPLARAERRWIMRHDVPVGTSVAVVATRD
jgi:ubiquinone/menaquinone biosynthesis C-methylase UbiE